MSNLVDSIVPGLFLGGHAGAQSLHALKQNGITHIINMASSTCSNYFPQDFVYKSLACVDTPSQNLLQHFPETSSFIHEARRVGGRVFVHCIEGKSRSASVVIAYLIDYENMGLNDALLLCKRQRPIVQPNEGFAIQLSHYETLKRGTAPMQQPMVMGSTFGNQQAAVMNQSFLPNTVPQQQRMPQQSQQFLSPAPQQAMNAPQQAMPPQQQAPPPRLQQFPRVDKIQPHNPHQPLHPPQPAPDYGGQQAMPQQSVYPANQVPNQASQDYGMMQHGPQQVPQMPNHTQQDFSSVSNSRSVGPQQPAQRMPSSYPLVNPAHQAHDYTPQSSQQYIINKQQQDYSWGNQQQDYGGVANAPPPPPPQQHSYKQQQEYGAVPHGAPAPPPPPAPQQAYNVAPIKIQPKPYSVPSPEPQDMYDDGQDYNSSPPSASLSGQQQSYMNSRSKAQPSRVTPEMNRLRTQYEDKQHYAPSGYGEATPAREQNYGGGRDVYSGAALRDPYGQAPVQDRFGGVQGNGAFRVGEIRTQQRSTSLQVEVQQQTTMRAYERAKAQREEFAQFQRSLQMEKSSVQPRVHGDVTGTPSYNNFSGDSLNDVPNYSNRTGMNRSSVQQASQRVGVPARMEQEERGGRENAAYKQGLSTSYSSGASYQNSSASSHGDGVPTSNRDMNAAGYRNNVSAHPAGNVAGSYRDGAGFREESPPNYKQDILANYRDVSPEQHYGRTEKSNYTDNASSNFRLSASHGADEGAADRSMNRAAHSDRPVQNFQGGVIGTFGNSEGAKYRDSASRVNVSSHSKEISFSRYNYGESMSSHYQGNSPALGFRSSASAGTPTPAHRQRTAGSYNSAVEVNEGDRTPVPPPRTSTLRGNATYSARSSSEQSAADHDHIGSRYKVTGVQGRDSEPAYGEEWKQKGGYHSQSQDYGAAGQSGNDDMSAFDDSLDDGIFPDLPDESPHQVGHVKRTMVKAGVIAKELSC